MDSRWLHQKAGGDFLFDGLAGSSWELQVGRFRRFPKPAPDQGSGGLRVIRSLPGPLSQAGTGERGALPLQLVPAIGFRGAKLSPKAP
jgi:hypothetical protein